MRFITSVNIGSIDLNLLLIVSVVLEENSVTRAAERLHVTQSAVSNALARARVLYGDPLFVRQGRTLVATPVAEALRPALQRLLKGAAEVLGEIGDKAPTEIARTFTLACSDA